MKLSFGLRFVLPFAAVIAVAQSGEHTWIQPVTPKPPPAKTSVPAAKDNPAWRKRALELIQNSHALNPQLTFDGTLFGLINLQAQIATRLDLDLARAWTIDGFELAKQLDSHSTFMAQMSLSTSLRQADPDTALRLFTQIDPTDAANFSPLDSYFNADPYRRSASAVFQGYVRNGRDPSKLQEAAEEMGAKGFYPYSALMMSAATSGDARQAQMFAALLARYQQQSTSIQDDADFASMLQNPSVKIPPEQFKTAVQVLTQRILHYDKAQGTGQSATVTLSSNKTVKVQGAVEIPLLRILPLIEKADPALLKQVVASYPNLAPAQDSDGMRWSSIHFSGAENQTQAAQVPDAREQAIKKLRMLRWTDPEQARKAAEAVPDPAIRAQALTEMLQEQSDDPKAVQELLVQVEAAAKDAKDAQTQFHAALAKLISASAAKNKVGVNEALEPTFFLADKLTEKADEGDNAALDYIYDLQQAVAECIKVSTESTIGFINGLTQPYARAMVLASAASGLSRDLPKAQPKKPAK